MEVQILKGCQTAKDCNDKVYKIEGIQITRNQTGEKVFYGKETHFYYCATHENIKSQAYLLENGKIMLT